MINNLSQLKKQLKAKDKIEIINHLRGEQACGVYEVGKTYTNSFTIVRDGKDSFMYYPKTSLISFNNGLISFYANGKEYATEEDNMFFTTYHNSTKELTWNQRQDYCEEYPDDIKRAKKLLDEYNYDGDNKELYKYSDKVKGDLILTMRVLNQ